ncbi:MAG: hypothetical protein ACRDBO_19365 [Lachnospiraceae bacterium]
MVDCDGTPLEPTYIKRARQLVKNQRAEWVSENTVRMKLQYVEEYVMAEEAVISVDAEDTSKKPLLDDEAIMELAKRRLAIKKNLFQQAVDYAMILFCFILLAAVWDYETKILICLFFSFAWGARLLYRIAKFAKPSFKDGISAYLKKRNDYKIESEFNRLKAEYLNEVKS